MSEFYTEKDEEEESPRRKELLLKIKILKEKFPSINITEINNDVSDDQLEIMYLKKLIEIEDRSKFKETLEKLAIILPAMFPATQSSNKSDLTIHHIIKFEK